MRIPAAIAVIGFSLLSIGCEEGGVLLQNPQQGEWANFHNVKHQVSKDAQPEPEKPAPEK
jgi:hypothetical protein